MHVARYETVKDGVATKEFRPFVYCRLSDGAFGWRRKHPHHRPLYGQDRLAARPDAPRLHVEGEKDADGAAARFPDYVATTSEGGCGCADYADLTPAKDWDEVRVWPDNDEGGRSYAIKMARH